MTNVTERLRVLIVEDEPLICMMLEDMLEILEADVVGVCATLAQAQEAITDGDFEGVLLDLKLGSQRTEDIAAQLHRDGIPFAVMTGDIDGAAGLGAAMVVPKPYDIDQIEAALSALRSARVSNKAKS